MLGVLGHVPPLHRRAQACAIFSRLVGLLVAARRDADFVPAYRAAFVLAVLLRASPAAVAADINGQYEEEIGYVLSRPEFRRRVVGRTGFFAARSLALFGAILARCQGKPCPASTYGPMIF